MGTDYACCGTDDPIHNQVNTEIATRTTDANIEQIQDELVNAKNEKEQINEKYQKLHQQYETEQKEKSKLMSQVQETNQKYHKLTESQTLMNKEYDHRIERSKSELVEVQKKLDAMIATKVKYESVNDEIEQYKAVNIALREEVNEYKQNIHSLKQQNDEYLQIKTKLQNEIDELSQIIKSKQLENESISDLKESEMIKLQNQIKILQQQKEKMGELELENAKQNEIINAINDQMNAQNEEKKTLEDELSRLQTKMSEYLLDNEAIKDSKYAQLNEEYEVAIKQKEKLMKEIEESRHRYNELNKEYQAKMEKYKIEINELQQTLLNDQNNAMNEMEDLKQQNIKLDDVKTKLEEKINELTEIIDAKHSENIFNNQNDEMMGLQNEINELQQQNEKMALFESENERQRNMIHQLTEKMNEEIIQKEALENELAALQIKLTDFEQKRDEYLKNDNDADSKYMQLEIEYQRELENKQILLQQIKESNEKYEELENAQNIFREKYEIKMEKYENEINALQQTLEDTLGNDENTQNEMNEYKMSNTKLTEQLNEYKENVTNLEQKTSDFEAIRNDLESTINELKNEQNEKEKDVNAIKEQNEKLTALINEMSAKMEAKNNENLSLTKELDSMQFKLYKYEQKEDEEKQRLRQIEIDKIDLNYKELHAIRSDETTLTPMRVQHVVDASVATDFENIPGIVLKRYKTPTHDPESDTVSELDADDEEIETSISLASHDKLEIAKRKSIQKQQLFLQAEKKALHAQLKSLHDLEKLDMRKELNALKRVNTAKKATMSVTHTPSSKDNGTLLEYSKTELTDHYSDLDVLTPVNGPISPSNSISEQDLPPINQDSSRNIFRFRSESRWDENELKQQKKEMAEQMIHLVKTHVQKSVEYGDSEHMSVMGTEPHIPALPPQTQKIDSLHLETPGASFEQKSEEHKANLENKATDDVPINVSGAANNNSNLSILPAEPHFPPIPLRKQKSATEMAAESIKMLAKKATDVVSVSVTMENELKTMHESILLFLSSNLGIDKQIPLSLIANAKAIIWLRSVEASFGVGASIGTGILLAKLQHGNGGWSGPCALGQLGGQAGFKMGATQTDFLIIVRNESALTFFIENGQINFGNSNASIAIGPTGRNVQIEGDEAIVHYSMAKGMHVGVSLLKGDGLLVRDDANEKYYGKQVEIKDILSNNSTVENKDYDAICKLIDGYNQNYDENKHKKKF